ncbi:hypothetical protein C2E23DRAFT_810502 [Lenzites betulinus]|nr:hypothetical protein C2E23DRAFT_810502 [Lenzites betulinus]
MPTCEEYSAVEEEYLASLDPRKKAKALISQQMFDNIWLVLHYPDDLSIETPQFRWWVRKMFTAAETGTGADLAISQENGRVSRNGSARVLIHGGKRVAVKEMIFEILCFCHNRADHGGRDRTAAEVRKRYTWIPKELIAGFVRSCPTCIYRRTGKYDEERVKKEESVSETYLTEDYAHWDQNNDYAVPERAVETRPSFLAVASRPHLVPLRDFSAGPTGGPVRGAIPSLGSAHTLGSAPTLGPVPTLGSVPTFTLRDVHHVSGPNLRLIPGLVPWYMPSPLSGPQISPGSSLETVSGSFAHVLSVLGPRWQIPGTMQGLPNHPREHFRLPSIHTCGKTIRSQPEGSPKVTLPPVAQLLAGDQAHRRPFGAILKNTSPESRGFSSYAPTHQPYVPQIDPALLPDGVHMLALAAEAAQTRDAVFHGHRAGE